jgi:hypothetical protein
MSVRPASGAWHDRDRHVTAAAVGCPSLLARMFGPVLPEQSIVLLLGLVFSVIAPFVLLAALVFFLMSLLVDTYNWVWVFRRPYDGAGKLWKQVCVEIDVCRCVCVWWEMKEHCVPLDSTVLKPTVTTGKMMQL